MAEGSLASSGTQCVNRRDEHAELNSGPLDSDMGYKLAVLSGCLYGWTRVRMAPTSAECKTSLHSIHKQALLALWLNTTERESLRE